MIINSIADYQVTKDQNVAFNFRDIKYIVSGSSRKIEGIVPKNGYDEFDAAELGAPPYTVQVGYVNDSYRAAPIQVNSNDTLVTFRMGFPAPPNGPATFVYNKKP
jgi:hypothetical protein